MARRAGNAVFLKEYNRRQLMSLIRQHKSISGTQLSKLSGLAPKSVYEICAGLIDEGYLYESDIGDSEGGRKPVMLSLKPDGYYSIGIDIDVGIIRAVLMDISSTVKFERAISINGTDYDDYLESIIDTAKALNKEYGAEKSKFLGIGVSVPGLVDVKTKKIIIAPNLEWENKDIIADIRQSLECEVYIENEAMSSAFCEKWIGECRDDSDFICINIKSGIGAGIYTCNRPYRGASGSAGEIGHIPLDENGPLCGCKNRGCLETLASTKALISNAKHIFNPEMTPEELICLAQEGDKNALGIFTKAAEFLGTAVSFLVNTYNPSKIILGKDFTGYAHLELDTLQSKVMKTALRHNTSAVDICVSEFGERASVLGAAILPQIILF